MNQNYTRRHVIGGLATASALSVAGCLSSDGSERDVFRVASPWKPDSIDPLTGGSTLQRIGVLETLIGTNYESELSPWLASDWTIDESAQRFTFDLRRDITFHDGTEMDAEIVADSLRRTFEDPSFAGVPVNSTEVVDEMAIEIQMDEPFTPLLAHLTRPEAGILAPGSFDGGEFEEPVGTGPFAFESWEPQTSIEAQAHDEYHKATVQLDGVIFEGIEDDRTRLLNLQNGDVDMARLLPASDLNTVETDENIKAYTYSIPRSRFAVFDTNSEPFADRQVRQAMLHALDRQEISETLLEGITDPAVGPFPSDVTDWANEDLSPYEYDPNRANELLADAGWTRSDSETRTRDGTPLEIDISTYSARPVLPPLMEIMQAQLGEVGFDVSVEILQAGTIEEQAQSGSFDIYLWSSSMLWYPDPDRLRDLLHSRENEFYHGYENTRADELLDQGRETVGYDQRQEIYDEVQTIVHKDLPIAFLTDYTNVHGTNTGLENYRPHPLEERYGVESITLDES